MESGVVPDSCAEVVSEHTVALGVFWSDGDCWRAVVGIGEGKGVCSLSGCGNPGTGGLGICHNLTPPYLESLIEVGRG